MKKILLIAINAKYIHSNLAVYDLKAYAEKFMSENARANIIVQYREFTINQMADQILEEIYGERADVLCFSCYIWNVGYVKMLIREIRKLQPDVEIWLGGPEVSYDAEELMEQLEEVTGIMCGEGERIFTDLCDYYGEEQDSLEQVSGIVYRDRKKHIVKRTGVQPPINLSDIPFPYGTNVIDEPGESRIVPNALTDELKNRIVYYESSRGCPFSCSYCLSSIDKALRFRELGLVKQELQFFIDNRVKQVKFVDRTFNCKKNHALAIWKYILEHDNGVTNFHFEIGADLLSQEEIEVLKQMRPGLVQLEIGVQSTNEMTIKEVSRKMNLSNLRDSVEKIRGFQNINLHLDLIAGLPYEDFLTFQKSFDDVYQMYPDQLQLGFLKVLKGSDMSLKKETYGMAHKAYPPYEVLYTKWLGFDEILILKNVENMVENYYNSGQFTCILKYMEKYFQNPFSMFFELGEYYEKHFDKNIKHARMDRYFILRNFLREKIGGDTEDGMLLDEIMMFDIYLRENMKTRPEFGADVKPYKKLFHEVSVQCGLEQKEHVEIFSAKAWEILQNMGVKAGVRKVSMEVLQGQKLVYFDYQNRNPLNYNAKVYELICENTKAK